MATHGKKYRAAFEKVDRAKRYSFQEAAPSMIRASTLL